MTITLILNMYLSICINKQALNSGVGVEYGRRGGVELGEDFSLEWGQTQKYKNTDKQPSSNIELFIVSTDIVKWIRSNTKTQKQINTTTQPLSNI